MATRTTRPGTEDPGEVATSAYANSVPGGWLGYAKLGAAQAGITTEVDLTGLSLTVTVNANRLLKLTANMTVSISGGTGSRVSVYIKEGVTYLGVAEVVLVSASSWGAQLEVMALVVAPSAGAHTYKCSLARNGDTTAGTYIESAAQGPVFLVEDIGPSS